MTLTTPKILRIDSSSTFQKFKTAIGSIYQLCTFDMGSQIIKKDNALAVMARPQA